MIGSTPTLTEFDPTAIPFQYQVIKDVRKNFDYKKGKVHEILLSGSVGSAKSLLAAHLAVTHCLLYKNAVVLVGRKAMPSLKDTILKKILEHIGTDVDFSFNKQRGIIEFPNGSLMIPYSWADGHIDKVRSLDLSAAVIEELTENENMEFYKEIRMRVGRLPHVKESWVISCTNPGSPTSEFYDYFINSEKDNRHVYYSKTSENPFLPEGYIDGLLESLDEKMARRMIYGEWIEITQEVIYYAYDRSKNFIDKDYQVNVYAPIHVSFDFNIGLGKPLSCCFFQYLDGKFHFFDEVVVEGFRTEDALEEALHRGLFDYPTKYIINGDATGRHNDTRSKLDDYEIIEDFLSNAKNSFERRINFEIDVPRSNPPIRERHNKVNAFMKNAKGEVRLFVYKKAKSLDKGFRLTTLKKGSQYIEDDSFREQHITTAAGYGIMSVVFNEERRGVHSETYDW